MMQSTLDPPAALASPNPLLIPELLQCILGGFHLPKPGDNRRLVKRPKELRESQQALAALGQTCRALLEPSLDRLWQRLDSLEPLIRSFSPVYDWERACVSRFSLVVFSTMNLINLDRSHHPLQNGILSLAILTVSAKSHSTTPLTKHFCHALQVAHRHISSSPT